MRNSSIQKKISPDTLHSSQCSAQARWWRLIDAEKEKSLKKIVFSPNVAGTFPSELFLCLKIFLLLIFFSYPSEMRSCRNFSVFHFVDFWPGFSLAPSPSQLLIQKNIFISPAQRCWYRRDHVRLIKLFFTIIMLLIIYKMANQFKISFPYHFD